MGDLYHYPAQVLAIMRGLFAKELPVTLEAPAKVQLFVYDNNRMIVRSDLSYYESVTLKFAPDVKAIRVIGRELELPVENGRFTWQLAPGVNYVLELKK